MENKNFGELLRANVREILHEKRLTMAEAESKIGLPRALRNFLNGRQSTPSVGSLFLFSKALDVPMHRIFGESVADLELDAANAALLVKVVSRLLQKEDFWTKKLSLKRLAKMVLSLQKMTELAAEIDPDFLEEFLLKL